MMQKYLEMDKVYVYFLKCYILISPIKFIHVIVFATRWIELFLEKNNI